MLIRESTRPALLKSTWNTVVDRHWTSRWTSRDSIDTIWKAEMRVPTSSWSFPSRLWPPSSCSIQPVTDPISHQCILINDEKTAPADPLSREGAMPHKKPNLPEKICVACGRSFAWRRKWATHWEQVRYCSERCRNGGAATTQKTENRSNSPSSRRPSQSS